MPEPQKDFDKKFFQKTSLKGLSATKARRILALQSLSGDVLELYKNGQITSDIIYLLTRISDPIRQKVLAEMSVKYKLPRFWVNELSKLIVIAETEKNKQMANNLWDFFFEIKNEIEQNGISEELFARVRNFLKIAREEKQRKALIDSFKPEMLQFNNMDVLPGRGLDCGTTNIKASAQMVRGEIIYNIQRNAFLDLKFNPFTSKLLLKLGIDGVQSGQNIYVLGDPAFALANVFGRDVRRPMRSGVINPQEEEAIDVFKRLLLDTVGKASRENEVCSFIISSKSIDTDADFVYQIGLIEAILKNMGYKPVCIEEGFAVVLSELAGLDFTGVGISCGGGMFNVCISYKGIPALTFSIARGGDWIDAGVAKSTNISTSEACAIKESGMDISKPRDKVQDAIAIYYRYLIKYTLENIKNKFELLSERPVFVKPVELVCAGGASMMGGFIDVFYDELKKINLPFVISDVRLAENPMMSVAKGCLFYAQRIT